MATYVYKAMTKNGLVVKNKVEAATKESLIHTLKQNDMLPISINKAPNVKGLGNTRKKRNISQMEEFMQSMN